MARASIKRCRKRARALTERAPKGTLFFGRRIRPRGRDQVTGLNFGAEARQSLGRSRWFCAKISAVTRALRHDLGDCRLAGSERTMVT